MACRLLVLALAAATAATAACAPDRDTASDAPAPSSPGPAAAEPDRSAAAPAEAATRTPDRTTLTLAGLGDIVIGEPPPPSLSEDATQISDECRTLRGAAHPGVYAMTDGMRVRRITVMRDSPVKTERGIGPGASEADVRAAYPNLSETPLEYAEAPARNLTFRPGGATSGLRFETDPDGRANLIHAGAEPWLAYSEGCA